MVQRSTYHPQEWDKESIVMESVVPKNGGLVPHALVIFYLTMTGILFLLVIMANGLIIVVNLTDWFKGRRLTPNDEILSSLALSSLFFATSLMTDYSISLVWVDFYGVFYQVQIVFMTLDVATSLLSFWFTAWLSVFYCMKIVNFKQAFLLKAKLKFPGLVRCFLLGSTLVSLGTALLVVLAVQTATHRKQAGDLSNHTANLPFAFNCTHNCGKIEAIFVHMSPFYRALVILLGSSLPLVVVVFSSVLVLYSLFKHTKKLEQNLSPSHSKAHVNAAKAVLSLLLCYIVLVASQTLARIEIYRNWYYEYFLCLIVQLATLLAQSTILSQSNPKLKQTAAWLLFRLPRRCRKGNSQTTTELQEV